MMKKYFRKKNCNCNLKMDPEVIFECLNQKKELTPEQLKFTQTSTDGLSYSNLGYLYLKGIHVDKDIKKAVELFEKGVKLGNRHAMCNLGTIYLSNFEPIEFTNLHIHSAKINIDKAFILFEKASELNEYIAMVNLGCMYNSDYKNNNTKKGAELFSQAAKAGNKVGVHNLGYMYADGTHPDGKNIKKAIELFKQAFNLGDYKSIIDLYALGYNDDDDEMYNIVKEKGLNDILDNIESIKLKKN